MNQLEQNGYQIIRSVFNTDEIADLRKEADCVAQTEGSACVRRLREKSAHFFQLATTDRLLKLLPDNLIPVRSILFDKTATENWPVAWHQDLTIAVNEKVDTDDYGPWSMKDGIVHVQPPEHLLKQMLTVRIHLDDTPATNGALKVIPGSHLKGKILSSEVKLHTSENEDVCACAAGDVLLMYPLILHSSSKSKEPDRRRIVHFEYALQDALDMKLNWHESQILNHSS